MLHCGINKAVDESEAPRLQLTKSYFKVYLEFARWKNTVTKVKECPIPLLVRQCRVKNTFVLYTVTGDVTFHPMFLTPQGDLSQHMRENRGVVPRTTHRADMWTG